VDALILGTVIPKFQKVSLTAKVITTDTAEIVGAAKAEFKMDATAQQLLAKPSTETTPQVGSGGSKQEAAKVVKAFGNVRVELSPLQVVNGNQFMLTMTFTNQNPDKSIWVAISYSLGGTYLKGTITDAEGDEFVGTSDYLSGVEYAWDNGGFTRATQIRPASAITATAKFFSRAGRRAAPGTCRLQLEILSANYFHPGSLNPATVNNLVTKIEAQ
jgi:hypothetical protein